MTERLAKQRRGCLFYGCLTVSALLVLLLVGVLLGARYIKKKFIEFTDTQPAPVPVVQVSPAEQDALQRRIEAFSDAVRAHRQVAPLVLTPQDINALIATQPEAAPLRHKLYVSIEGNQLKGQVSVPLGEIGLPFKDRYLNGVAAFDVALNNGTLSVHVESIRVKGKTLPALFQNRIRKQNLARDMANEPRAASGLDRLQDIQVKDGKLIIVPRPD